MITTVLGFVFVVSGFVIQRGFKRERKQKNLVYAFVQKSEKKENGFDVTIRYTPVEGESAVSSVIHMEKEPRRDYILVDANEYEVEVYKEKLSHALVPVVFWIAGAILCMV